MKAYKVGFAYWVNVEAENEDEAEIEAQTTMLELFPLSEHHLGEFACDVEELTDKLEDME